MKIAIFLIFTSTLPQALIAQAATVNDNLVENVSEKTVEEVSSSIQAEIKRRGLRLFSVIDHSANAKSVGKELPETVLILFAVQDFFCVLGWRELCTTIDTVLAWGNAQFFFLCSPRSSSLLLLTFRPRIFFLLAPDCLLTSAC